ncbi:MAG: Uma2 family endonuclease [Methylobacter sp.]|nr:Uma2 family endonuclease [Methylobacter sp.]
MSLNPTHKQISEAAYLQGELLAATKHEYIDGDVYAMAGASENHNLLSLNMASELRAQLKGTPCRAFMADMKVKVGANFFYPDVMVVCQKDDANEYYKNAPVIIVEILSKSTRHFDQTDKRLRCQQIPTLEEYVLIEQDKGEIQVFSKKHHWQSFYYYLGGEITFSSLGVTVQVEDIYYQVNNEDVIEFLQEKSS